MLYMVTWIPSIYPLYVSIDTSTMDPSWVLKYILNSNPLASESLVKYGSRGRPKSVKKMDVERVGLKRE